ncbi:hypothetical protein [Paenibacillus sp.]|uniref:hypothetical protein n=1 Tax=Paenibacillus sp. TaxID=58172 RepID=UPI002D372F74|nr:hypothetical protein [Paenibacillus sp.]HZG86729.1 hypothetical protein [Paenibacillus sp.]
MLFYVGLLTIGLAIWYVFKEIDIEYPFSRAVLMIIVLNLIGGMSLVENIALNMDPVANDGLFLSNAVVKLILREDGWSQELYRQAFQHSVQITFGLLFLYIVALVFESRRKTQRAIG